MPKQSHQIKSILLTLLLLCAVAKAQSGGGTSTVQLTWNPSLSSLIAPGLTYAVYEGTNSGQYSTNWQAGTNLSITVSNLTRGVTYYFSATCSTTNGLTSPYSAEAMFNS